MSNDVAPARSVSNSTSSETASKNGFASFFKRVSNLGSFIGQALRVLFLSSFKPRGKVDVSNLANKNQTTSEQPETGENQLNKTQKTARKQLRKRM